MTIKSKLNTTIYGGILRYPISDPEVIIAEEGLYAQGVLMDANSVEYRIEEHAKKHDVDTNTIMKRIDNVVSAQEQENQNIKLSISDTNKRITDLIGASPEQLDTIYELAMAIDNDALFVSTVNNKFAAVNTKVDNLLTWANKGFNSLNGYLVKIDLLLTQGSVNQGNLEFSDIIDDSTSKEVQWNVKQTTRHLDDKGNITEDKNGVTGSFSLPYANTTNAGAMSANDKKNIDLFNMIANEIGCYFLSSSNNSTVQFEKDSSGNFTANLSQPIIRIVDGQIKGDESIENLIKIPYASSSSDGVISSTDKSNIDKWSDLYEKIDNIITNLSFSTNNPLSDLNLVITSAAKYHDGTFLNSSNYELSLPVATGTTNGVMSKDDKQKLDKTSDKLNNLSDYYTFLKTSNNTGTKIKTLLKEGEGACDFIRHWINGNGNEEIRISSSTSSNILKYKENLPNNILNDVEKGILFDGAVKTWLNGRVFFGKMGEGFDGVGISIDNTNDIYLGATNLKLSSASTKFENGEYRFTLGDRLFLSKNGKSILGESFTDNTNDQSQYFQLNRPVNLSESDYIVEAGNQGNLPDNYKTGYFNAIIRYNKNYEEYLSWEDVEQKSPNYLAYFGFDGADFVECREGSNKITIPQTTFEAKDAVNKEYVDNLVNPLQYDYYGIKWTTNASGVMTSNPVRTGNLAWHKSLPIQSEMRRCTLLDDGTVNGYISDSDYTKYTDGRTVDYFGGDGLVMVEIPEYYFKAINEELSDGTYINELRLYPYSKQGVKSKKFYAGVSHAMADVIGEGADNAKLYSVCKTVFEVDDTNTINASELMYTSDAVNFKGGNRSAEFADSGVKSLLGRAITNQNIDTFRTLAMRRGNGWSLQYWSAYESIVRLYVVEYCSFNSLSDFNPNLTEKGYHQGGLGIGVTDYNKWSAFNSNNPLIPSLITKSLGNRTGIIQFKYNAGTLDTNEFTFLVPSYRGIENIFGHLWTFTDGIAVYGDSTEGKNYIYRCDNPAKFKNVSGNNIAPEGYGLICKTLYNSSGYITGIKWDELGEFVPTSVGGSANTYYTDYFWNDHVGWKLQLFGGSAFNGGAAGLLAFNVSDGFGVAWTHNGARLFYTP